MDITHTCTHCCRGRKVYRVSLDLYNEEGLLRRGVQRMKKFMFTCDYCSKKSFLDFYRFSHRDVLKLDYSEIKVNFSMKNETESSNKLSNQPSYTYRHDDSILLELPKKTGVSKNHLAQQI